MTPDSHEETALRGQPRDLWAHTQSGTLVRMHREPLKRHTPSLGGGPSGRRGDLGPHQRVKRRRQPGRRASLQGGGSSLPWAPLRPAQHLCEPRRQEAPQHGPPQHFSPTRGGSGEETDP